MSEVDEIETALTGPVNNWLNNDQLLKFQRLVQIARGGEWLLFYKYERCVSGSVSGMSEVDKIETALTGPVNNWLNNDQLLKFQRLVQIARGSERYRAVLRAMTEKNARIESSVNAEAE